MNGNPIEPRMKSYVVGGAVRDRLLGLPVKDRDHVVVGATPEQMVAQGFRPVGKDFPVFLHPQTNEEYALARTERKTAPGYKGFVFHTAPEVTLEQDLVRRDLTINAIAEAEDGTLIDPHGGQRDLAARVFRHVSAAFAEDPVRILRLARFAARFDGFVIAAETMALMQSMVAAGEVDALVAERVWQELARGLMAAHPELMFAVLQQCGALARLGPELLRLWGGEHMPETVRAALAQVVARQAGLAQRFAALLVVVDDEVNEAVDEAAEDADDGAGGANDGKTQAAIAALAQRWRVPRECSELALLAAREKRSMRTARTPEQVVGLFERCDALRKPDRFGELLCLFSGAAGAAESGAEPATEPAARTAMLAPALLAAREVDAGAIAAATVHAYPGQPQKIAAAVHAARVAAVAAVMASSIVTGAGANPVS